MKQINLLAITAALGTATQLEATSSSTISTKQSFPEMKFVTFNMLFSPLVEPSTRTRRNKTTNKTKKLDADVLCLQEIWDEDYIEHVEKRFKKSKNWRDSDIFYEISEDDAPWWDIFDQLVYDGHNGLMLISKKPIQNK